MMVHRAFKPDKLSNLNIEVSALYLMASPTTPVSVRDALIERAEDGDRVTHQQARASMNDYKSMGTASAKAKLLKASKECVDKDRKERRKMRDSPSLREPDKGELVEAFGGSKDVY